MRSAVVGWLLLSVAAEMFQPAPPSDREWRAWLDEVRPFLMPAEEKAAKKVPAAGREAFREDFWRLRDPDPSTPGNETRTQIETRVRTADSRFRAGKNGPWNDCGRTFVLLGKPDLAQEALTRQHFEGGDRLAAFREQGDTVAEVWIYRNHPRLPTSPEGFSFRFTQECEAVGGPSAQGVLQEAARSYLAR
jgi:GWxTD domain-containing protein